MDAETSGMLLGRVVASCTFFIFLLKFLLPTLSSKFLFYRGLSDEDKLQWNARVASTVHAAQISVVALRTVFITAQHTDDLLWLKDPISSWNLTWSCGYLLADLIWMGIYFRKVGGAESFIVHHCVALGALMPCICMGYLHYMANYRLMSELSTPSLNIRWFLAVSNKKANGWYGVNLTVLAATFVFTRIVAIPFFWYTMYLMVATESYQLSVGALGHWAWLLNCVVLDFLNIKWFMALVVGNLLKKLMMTCGRWFDKPASRTM